jgi:5'-3' exonuclease
VVYLFIGGMLTRSQAPGEAEAELAYLNRVGVIDGILSDDVDNFLFGATLVIRKQVCLPAISNFF